MLRNAFAVAAVLALTATVLPAQETSGQGSESAATGGQGQATSDNVVTAKMLESATVVSLEGQYDENVWQDNAPLSSMVADLTEIGHVQDIVLSVQGEVQGVTIDVGGFLGIATKPVLIPLGDMRLARPDPSSDELTIVTRLNEQQLNDLPEFKPNE